MAVQMILLPHSAINVIATLLLPHFSDMKDISFSKLLNGILLAVKKQKPIEYHGEIQYLNDPLLDEFHHFSRMIVASYGKKFHMKKVDTEHSLLMNMDFSELANQIDIQLGEEAYVEFLLQYCSLKVEDLLYCCFEGEVLQVDYGVEIHSPPFFILRDPSTRSIVLLIRGTQNLNDVIIDVYGKSMKWKEGYVHEVGFSKEILNTYWFSFVHMKHTLGWW